jgi:dTDP-4-amino-4,6-dideoxygalactose transaminase
VIPYGRQSIDEADIDAVVGVLRGDWLTQGPSIERFEEALAAYVGASHAVAFANGTAALHGACAAAGLGPGDRVGVPALTFSASAACARYVGAEPVLLDIDEGTLNLDPDALPPDLDAVVAVHYAGLPIDLARLAHRPRVVIEDACHALGARTPDGMVGSCARSDLCCFSFHPVKAITTAEGGAVTTNDPDLATRLRRFRSHGIVARPEQDGPWYYEVEELGFNYRLSDLHAVLGLAQLGRLDAFIARRNAIADRYDDQLPAAVVRPPRPPAGTTHAFHLYPARVPDRRRVFEGLRARGIAPQVHYVPLYRHPVYRQDPAAFPATEAVYAGLVSLPMYPDLEPAQQDQVVAALAELLA